MEKHEVEPGQFAHIRISDGFSPLLRRPFSYHHRDGKTLEFLYKVVGKGTRELTGKTRGDQLELMGPLGTPFELPSPSTCPVLMGGGVGVPPIHMLAQSLVLQWDGEWEPALFMGARTEKALLERKRFSKLGVNMHIATDDGSAGYEGVVTELFRDVYQKWDREKYHSVKLFGCGPHGMLDAIRQLALEYDLPADISIERQMGCALGVCRACVVKVQDEHEEEQVVTTCREGPVFSVRSLCADWDNCSPSSET